MRKDNSYDMFEDKKCTKWRNQWPLIDEQIIVSIVNTMANEKRQNDRQ